jgi:polysaccharide chain length determinant protein (PEP-CTERM system associated)
MIREEVMSRARLGALITNLDLYVDLKKRGASFDDVVEQMRRDVGFEVKGVDPQLGRGPTIAFAISYRGRDPETVARVANVLASSYVDENTKIREGQAVRTAEFLKAQLAEAKKVLDAQEQRVSQFNMSHLGELPQQVSANLASLERLNTQLRLNGENQVRTMDRRERLERQLADLGPAQSSPATATGSRNGAGAEQAVKLRKQLGELKGKFTDQYPDVLRLKSELADVERQLAEHDAETPSQTGPAPAAAGADPKARLLEAIGGAEAELQSLKNEELALRRAVESYEQRVDNVPRREEEFQAINRDYTTTKERYDGLLKRYEDAHVAATLEQGQSVEQFRILDAATAPREPAAPSRVKLLAMGFVLSVALAVCAVVLIERLDTTFHTVDSLRAYVSVPTLFTIPVIPTAQRTRRKLRRLAVTAVLVATGLALIVAGSRHLALDNERIVRLTTRGNA